MLQACVSKSAAVLPDVLNCMFDLPQEETAACEAWRMGTRAPYSGIVFVLFCHIIFTLCVCACVRVCLCVRACVCVDF